jgi:hypothetical protein
VWGWSPKYTVPKVTVPALFLWGYLDNVTPNAALPTLKDFDKNG